MARFPVFDARGEIERIAVALGEVTRTELRRRGLVVALSGGVDSSVCAALAVRAVGRERVFGLLLPERDSSGDSVRLARQLAAQLGIAHELQDISAALAALGCYTGQVAVLQRAIPGFAADWRFKLVLREVLGGRVAVTTVVAEDPAGGRHEARLAAGDYLALIAATNFKQRVRKTIEYHHADRLGYAVVGTPNRLEYDQGFFVKNGDGAADVKPIAHLYKTQVYALAGALGLPAEIVAAIPTTDTFSLAQGQDEFYFGLPYQQMDLALWHLNAGHDAAELARELGTDVAAAERIYAGIRSKRRAAAYLQAAPVLLPPGPDGPQG